MCFFFFFNDTATTEIYTLSLHDALPISTPGFSGASSSTTTSSKTGWREIPPSRRPRSEEHTSELQSRPHLVCRLLLEKKKQMEGANPLLAPPSLRRPPDPTPSRPRTGAA